MDLQTSICQSLKCSAAAAVELSRILKQPKHVINQCLYTMKRDGIVTSVPDQTGVRPIWSLVPSEQKTPPTIMPIHTYVIIDLGNIHHVLQQLEPFAKEPGLQVMAFADKAYNGYPIGSCCYWPYYQVTTTHTNAADIEIIAYVVEKALEAQREQRSVEFHVVTRDQQFQQLKDIVERKGHTLTFSQSWEELRIYLE